MKDYVFYPDINTYIVTLKLRDKTSNINKHAKNSDELCSNKSLCISIFEVFPNESLSNGIGEYYKLNCRTRASKGKTCLLLLFKRRDLIKNQEIRARKFKKF